MSSDNQYKIININGWDVTFRFRDRDRIKIDSIEKRISHPLINDHTTDDCSGDEFLSFLNQIRDTK